MLRGLKVVIEVLSGEVAQGSAAQQACLAPVQEVLAQCLDIGWTT